MLRVLQVLFSLASDPAGATLLLDLSVFTVLSHCPLLLLNSPPGYAVSPSKLSSRQKEVVRRVVRSMLLLVLALIQTVRSFRGLRTEVLQFVRSSVNLSLVLLEDVKEEDSLALDTLGLYEAVLALLACRREDLKTELNGFEEVIAEKMVNDLKRVEGDKGLLRAIREGKKEEMRRIVENSVVFLEAYGESVPASLLK